jgi:hypothetical protein
MQRISNPFPHLSACGCLPVVGRHKMPLGGQQAIEDAEKNGDN